MKWCLKIIYARGKFHAELESEKEVHKSLQIRWVRIVSPKKHKHFGEISNTFLEPFIWEKTIETSFSAFLVDFLFTIKKHAKYENNIKIHKLRNEANL